MLEICVFAFSLIPFFFVFFFCLFLLSISQLLVVQGNKIREDKMLISDF